MRLVSWHHELLQDALIALRQLRRSPGFATVATVTLALGIGATTTVFAVVDAVMLRPLPFREPNQLVVITRERPGGGATVEMTYPEFRDLRDNSKSFSGLAALPSAIQSAAWTDGTSSEPLGAVAASGNLFEMLGDVQRLVIGETLRTVGVGIVVGVLAALAGTRVIRALVYDVSAADPLTFTLVPLAVLVVAVLAAAIPARRASRVDPIAVLRME